jgi:hypothetical protein
MGNAIVSEEVAYHILQFTDWEDRRRAGHISRRCRQVTTSVPYYHWCCERLAQEHFVYSPVDYIPVSWEAHLKELFRLKDMWNVHPVETSHLTALANGLPADEADQGKANLYKINVYARFRPDTEAAKDLELKKALKKPAVEDMSPSKKDEKACQQEDKENDQHSGNNDCVEVSLPLYQRLAMIKMSHNLKSNKAALKVLAAEGGWFQKKWNSVNCVHADERIVDQFEKVEHIPKFRENSEKEATVASVQSVDSNAGRVVMIAPDVGLR